LDIGKDDVDIRTRFQDGNGLVGIGRLDDLEARAFDRLSGIQPQQQFVFYDQDHRADTRHNKSSRRAKRVENVLFRPLSVCPGAETCPVPHRSDMEAAGPAKLPPEGTASSLGCLLQ
jgi:hypothetical protein